MKIQCFRTLCAPQTDTQSDTLTFIKMGGLIFVKINWNASLKIKIYFKKKNKFFKRTPTIFCFMIIKFA